MDNFIPVNLRPASRSMYPEQMTAPMAKELTDFGFDGLRSADEVSEKLGKTEGTTLLVVNSVCGCAAAMARPGVKMSLSHDKKPDQLLTVFAGVDGEAVQMAREFMVPYPPSSPAIALFKDGQLVHLLERRHIEGRSAAAISENLKTAFDTFC